MIVNSSFARSAAAPARPNELDAALGPALREAWAFFEWGAQLLKKQGDWPVDARRTTGVVRLAKRGGPSLRRP